MTDRSTKEVMKVVKNESVVQTRATSRPRLVTILTNDNFNVWKWELKYNLKTAGLYECVTSETIISTEKDDLAMCEIISTLSEPIKVKVSHFKTSFELYKGIERLYVDQSSFQLTALHMKLSTYKFKNVEEISVGLSEIQTIAAKIKNLGESISDHMLEGVILAALPSSFRTFVTVWKGLNEQERTLGNLMNRITSEIEDDKLFHSREDKALIGRFKDRKNFRKNNRFDKESNKDNEDRKKNADKTCYFCKKKGHVIAECRKLANKNKKMQEDNQGIDKTKNSASDNKSSNQSGQSAGKDQLGLVSVRHMLSSPQKWIVDSGATCHMTPNREWLKDYYEFKQNVNIYLGNNEYIPALGSGTIATTRGIMSNVYYVPEISTNLFSVHAVTGKGLVVQYDNEGVRFFKDNNLILTGHIEDRVYVIDFEVYIQDVQSAFVARTIDDWHQRLGHASKRTILEMAKHDVVNGLNIKSDQADITCVDCAKNKGQCASHPSSNSSRSEVAGAVLHMDTVGKINTASLAGSHYFILCKDEATGYRIVRFMQSKAEIPNIVKSIINQVELETKNKVLSIRSDNGSEFINNNLQTFLTDRGINHSTSAVYTPAQNGYIERDIKTVTQSARTMLNQANAEKFLWAESVNTAVYILNRIPNSRKPMTTPYEGWFGDKPNVKNLKVFGQQVVMLKPLPEQGDKFDETGEVMSLVGYTGVFNTYRLYSKSQGRIHISCNVRFIEGKYQREPVNNPIFGTAEQSNVRETTPQIVYMEMPNSGNDSDSHHDADSHDAGSHDADSHDADSHDAGSHDADSSQQSVYETPRKNDDQAPQQSTYYDQAGSSTVPKHLYIGKRPPTLLPSRLRSQKEPTKESEIANIATLQSEDDPTSFRDAMSRDDSGEWKQAMKEEIDSLHKNKVWDLVERPKDTNIVTNRWVMRIKRKPDGAIERYRARLVARGFTQVHGIDYHDTYSPVVNATTIRILLAFAAIKNLILKQFDVKSAFLYGYLDEEVFMEQPDGFQDGTDKVCLLKKSLYGLKQAPRQWNLEFDLFLKGLGLVQSTHDRCVYYRPVKPILILALYVDDGLILSDSEEQVKFIMSKLKNRFEIHEVEPNAFLGFQIERKHGNIIIHQESYMKKVLEKFKMDSARKRDNPAPIMKYCKAESEAKDLGPEVPYRELVGSLMYASVNTRIDLAYAVNKISRSVASPTTYDWLCANNILHYIKDKESYGIEYSNLTDDGLVAFCDADFAGDKSGRSTTGYVVMLAGAPIHWKSEKQKLVTLSSTEAELVSLCSLVKDIIWIRNLTMELDIIVGEPTTVFCDNESAIRLAKSENAVQRTRHIGARAAFTREQVESGTIIIHHVRSQDQAADFLTKPLTSNSFVSNRNRLMYTMTLLMSLIMCANATMFEETKPIIWIPTHNYVDAGVVEYQILFTPTSPCAQLQFHLGRTRKRTLDQIVMPPNQTPNQGPMRGPIGPPQPGQQFSPPLMNSPPQTNQVMDQQQFGGDMDINIFNTMKKECDNMFDLVFMAKFKELQSRSQTYHRTPDARNKRDLIDTAERIGEVVCGTCITNLITSVFKEFYPDSDRNRIKHLEQEMAKQNELVQEFEQKFNLTAEIHRGILDSMAELDRRQKAAHRQMMHVADMMPRVSWTASYMMTKIYAAASDMSTIVNQFIRGHVATREMAEFLNISRIAEINNEDTRFLSVENVNPTTIFMRFLIREKSKDTFVYKVNAFTYWDNLTQTPSMMEYRGYKYLIFNESNSCLKAIEEPATPAVLDTCEIANFTDQRLQDWQVLVTTQNIKAYKNMCQIKRTLDYHYIYCFPWEITMKSITSRMPPKVFRLSLDKGFSTPFYNYTPVVRRYNITSGNEFPAVDSIHLGHFPMGSEVIDETKWFDEIQKLRNINQQLVDDQSATVSVVKNGVVWWISITLLVLLICATLGLAGYNLILSRRTMDRNKLMARDVNDLKSTYSEMGMSTLTLPVHVPAPIQQKQSSQPSIEVIGDRSITINMARPLPPAPERKNSL